MCAFLTRAICTVFDEIMIKECRTERRRF